MKTTTLTTTLAFAAFWLIQLALAQPHGVRHAGKHEKRDVVIDTVIDTVYAKATDAPEVIVIVNQFGTPVSTTTTDIKVLPSTSTAAAIPSTNSSSTMSSPSSTSSASIPSPSTVSPASAPVVAAPIEAAPIEAAPVEAAPVEAVKIESSTPVAPDPVATTSEKPDMTSSAVLTSSSSSSEEASGFGFAYSPYNADSSCKTQDQVNADFDSIPSGYSLVRTYGTDCNQVATVLSAAKSKGLKMFAGIFDLSTLSSEIATIVSAANGDWSSFDTISIGNELVNDGTATAPEVVAAIGTARSFLKTAGYTGKVVTVDTLVAARANPSLCDASDYCSVNCHPFFDGHTVAADSGSFLTTQISSLREVLSNQSQDIVITETGWPWKGETNGVAVPSTANQAAALSSIKSTFSSNPDGVILFSTFNDVWKTNSAGEFQAEQYWGFLGNSPSG